MKSINAVLLALVLASALAACGSNDVDDGTEGDVDTVGANSRADSNETRSAADDLDTIGDPHDSDGVSLPIGDSAGNDSAGGK